MPMKKMPMKKIFYFSVMIILAISVVFAIYQIQKFINKNKVLKQVIERLEADSRIAEVFVTNVSYDKNSKKVLTTIKFLEYDTKGRPLDPLYFSFPGNIIQFQSLVIRFDNEFIRQGDPKRGKSVYLFWKVFMLDGPRTLEYTISELNKIPNGYKLENSKDSFEEELWKKFWQYALDPNQSKKMGIRNAQIEAPGTMFIPGTLYTIKIEHDGGIRIDALPLPAILKGERIPG